MTSKLPEHLFAGIGDVREKHTDRLAQTFALSRTYPPPFTRRDARDAPSYQEGRQFTFNLNFDAATVVLRHLYSTINANYRHSESIAREELNHPLLRFMWADFESRSSSAAQNILRHEMQCADDPEGKITVSELFERPAMWNSLWARRPFRLTHPDVLGRPRGAKAWDVIPPEDTVVEDSLVAWEGAGDLGDHISSRFGRFSDAETGDQFVYSFGHPAIIRVRYQHTAQGQPLATYRDLRQIHVTSRQLKVVREGPFTTARAVPEKDTERVLYTLVAVVRCSDQAGEADRIRLYSVIGQPISLPTSFNKYVGTYWNVGDPEDPGRPYLLFYARAPGDFSGLHEEPIAHKEMGVGALNNALETSHRPKDAQAGEGSSA
ncbi:hypothetical protein F5X98DRAFT_347661 [Xylaria grammica]|nr:hypothetical protein F5X98DRAFT_347661 [Xylaria grammica]